MDRLSNQLEESVRAEFSNRLADMANAPRITTHKLAVDTIEVARPVLQRSKILSDDFLVKVAQTQSQDHLVAISNREDIASKVTDALVNRGNDKVLSTVTSNQGANFSRQGFEKLSQEASKNANLNNLLENRVDTPADLLKVVKQRVAKKLKEEAQESSIDLSEQEIDASIELNSQDIEISDAKLEAAYQEIEYLHKRKQLDERVVMHYVKLERVDETIYSLALLTELDRKTVKHALLTAQLPVLAIMCKANSFQRSTFASLLQLRENLSNIESAEIIEAIRRYEGIDLSTAQRVMRFLKVRGIKEATIEEIGQEVDKAKNG